MMVNLDGKRNIFQIGIFIPLLLFLAFVSDTFYRFTSIDQLCNSGIEAVYRFRQPDTPFEANKKFERDNCYGDLVYCAAHKVALTLRHEKFSCDEFGYRTDGEKQNYLPIIFAGSSLTAGVGVSDDETIPAKLGAFLGGNIYNAGQTYWQRNDRPVLLPLFHIDPERMLKIADRLQMKKGLVILEMPEEASLPYFYESELRSPVNKAKQMLSDTFIACGMGKQEGYLEGLLRASPLRRMAREGQNFILQKLDIPNPLEEKVAVKELKDGKPFLFNWRSIRYYGENRESDKNKTVGYIKKFRDTLSNKGFDLAVVFLPSKYSVYADSLKDYDRSVYQESPTYLEQLEKEFRGQKIKTLNLTNKLKEKAKSELSSHSYLFFPDDTHLTQKGIDFVAAEIAIWLKENKSGAGT